MTRREPPLHDEFDRPSSNFDQEWVNYLIAMGEGEESVPGLREAQLEVNDMLDKHEVDTIYRPGLSGEELLERGRGVLNSGLPRLESNDSSMLDLSAYEGHCNDDPELKKTVRRVIMHQILERVLMERSAIGVSLVEVASRTITGDTIDPMRKIAVITERLLDLKETPSSPWFKFLNEVLGGEDVLPEQVERAMHAQAAANKTRDQDAKFLEFLDGIFMETGGGLSDEQMLSVASNVTSLVVIEEKGGQRDKEGSLYSNYMAELKSIGLSDQQITELIAAHKEIMQKTSNAEE